MKTFGELKTGDKIFRAWRGKVTEARVVKNTIVEEGLNEINVVDCDTDCYGMVTAFTSAEWKESYKGEHKMVWFADIKLKKYIELGVLYGMEFTKGTMERLINEIR